MLIDPTITGGAAASLPRLAAVSAILAAVALAALTPFGYLPIALFGCLGLGLGLLNTALVHRSAARFSAGDGPAAKGPLAVGVLGRLAVITVIALGLAVLVQPAGLGVFGGLVAFQLVMISSTAGPLIRQLRSEARA